MVAPEERIKISKVALTEQLNQEKSSLLKKYQQKALGDERFLPFLRYELANLLFGDVSGTLGYALRKLTYPSLFKQVGKGAIFGKGIVLRHPGKITLGDRVAIDDYSMIDGSGGGDQGLILGNDVMISRNCVIQAKTGPLKIGNRADIGCSTIISAISGISIGDSVLIAGNCYIGGGRYISDRLDIPLMDQGLFSKGTVEIGDDVWLGAGATVLDGVKIGKGCIVGAGAVVTKNLPDYSIAVGVPAKVVQNRQETGRS
ncbi:DapH/DapD/GlmU-related protein [Lyngbya sp. PCC 8106]|uniref:acyltransferase n=1 Tax=Lyngbya sp. (strain PCC 8106) TaxID=313612 RepID=UPI0000EA9608|nr:acyltransferase [Lyngbya sp. PCC 8106]EAW33882.1 hypothetical protein L8106_08581 [Lyngbya sp. PCC 8106]